MKINENMIYWNCIEENSIKICSYCTVRFIFSMYITIVLFFCFGKVTNCKWFPMLSFTWRQVLADKDDIILEQKSNRIYSTGLIWEAINFEFIFVPENYRNWPHVAIKLCSKQSFYFFMPIPKNSFWRLYSAFRLQIADCLLYLQKTAWWKTFFRYYFF